MSEIKSAEKSVAQPPVQPKSALLVLRAETPLHAGAGSGAGEIDLPVQREKHTGWPVVWASSVKGALRERAERWAGKDITKRAQVAAAFGKDGKSEDSEEEKGAFGKERKGVDEYASALATSEAALLLLPVRSLTTHFKWVTCDAAIKRLQRTCARVCGGSATVDQWRRCLLERCRERAVVSGGVFVFKGCNRGYCTIGNGTICRDKHRSNRITRAAGGGTRRPLSLVCRTCHTQSRACGAG